MSRFYFDVRYDDGPWELDTQGVIFENRREAQAAAMQVLAHAAKGDVQTMRTITVQVRDCAPKPFVTVTLLVCVERP